MIFAGFEGSRIIEVRQTRYVFAFVMLSAFVLLMIVLNTVTGSVKIPLAEIAKQLVGRGTDRTAQNIVWQIRLRLSFADLFPQSDCRSLCAGDFLRRKADGGAAAGNGCR